MQLLDGKALAGAIREQTAKEIKKSGITPGLAVVLVGSDPASHLYVGLKEKAAAEIDMHFERHQLPQNIDQDTLLAKIEELNHDLKIHGILVQLPLPEHLNEDVVVAAIRPEKDVDGFHPKNIELLLAGTPRFIPSLIQGILALLDTTGVPIEGKTATVLSNSPVFSAPMKYVLQQRGMKVFTRSTQSSDLIISVLGKPHSISATQVKEGVILIDVGTTRVNNQILGDIHPDAVAKASWATPVPGGVGPMTVAMLLANTVEAVKIQNNHP